MKLEYRPYNFSNFRKLTQLGTARYILTILYWWRNRLTWSGRENVPPRGTTMLVVSNHLSNWDPPVLVIAVDRPMGFVAKEELFDKKDFGKLIEFYGAISINRDKPDKTTFKSIKQIVAKGWSMAMFIEGTRAKEPGVLGEPHLGAAFIARSNKIPILPVGLVGTNVKHGKAHATIGKLIQPSDDLEKTTWEVMEALSGLTGFKLPESRKVENA